MCFAFFPLRIDASSRLRRAIHNNDALLVKHILYFYLKLLYNLNIS